MSILPREGYVLPAEPISECVAPDCSAKPLPMLRIPLCRDCAADVAHQYYAERSAILGETVPEVALAPAPDPGLGTVYFIRFRDMVKIGVTYDLTRRLKELPHDEILGTIPGTPRDEARCHAAFAHLRHTGEWFRDAPELRQFIADVTASAA